MISRIPLYLVTSMALCLGIAPSSYANQPLRIMDNGMQGNQRFYAVSCPNGSRGSIVQTFNFTPTKGTPMDAETRMKQSHSSRNSSHKPIKVVNVCIDGGNLKGRQCRGSWELDEAGIAACR